MKLRIKISDLKKKTEGCIKLVLSAKKKWKLKSSSLNKKPESSKK
jgi:hypothetical protein